jgi:hypothetical protein
VLYCGVDRQTVLRRPRAKRPSIDLGAPINLATTLESRGADKTTVAKVVSLPARGRNEA